jgi:monofunctional biosynthetic peptidoglycan transglycosylase
MALDALGGIGERRAVEHEWVAWPDLSPNVALAVIASEDQRFFAHRGFDLDAIADAIGTFRSGGRLRGASTISQQVAKNLFLWPGRSLLRKGLEAYFTVLIELSWPKRRILEVYLNIAELGPGVYGVGAASHRFFAKHPRTLAAEEAALLAAVLPNPRRLNAQSPSRYVRQRQRWILRQMRQLGSFALLAGS